MRRKVLNTLTAILLLAGCHFAEQAPAPAKAAQAAPPASTTPPSAAPEAAPAAQLERERVLGYEVTLKLQRLHFDRRNRRIDDAFSRNAFDLFIKKLDPQKRIFLKDDLQRLSVFREQVDDELRAGKFRFFLETRDIVNRNLDTLEAMGNAILEKGFDYTEKETLEMDADKEDFCTSLEELRDRWRRSLKQQCLGQHLSRLLLAEEARKKLEATRNAPSGNVLAASGNALAASGNAATPPEKSRYGEPERDKAYKNLETYFSRMRQFTREEYFGRFLNAVAMTYDPHTNYMDPESKEDFDIQMAKSLEGIGAQLTETQDGFTKVDRIVPGSASHRQGRLKAGDIILRVAQGGSDEEVDVANMQLRDVVKHIRGPKGSTVVLTVKKPDGHLETIAIVRDIVKLSDALARSAVLKDKASGRPFGVLMLPDFYRDFSGKTDKNATDDVLREIVDLKKRGIEGLVFDLRNNGGGALDDARRISGLFIGRGPVVQVKSNNDMVHVLRDDRPVAWEGPLIVLVSRFSASASEIFAAAMQDHHRAVIVGTSATHGKGTVQNLMELKNEVPPEFAHHDLGSLKITIQKFYRVNGASTQIKGVEPDILLPDDRSAMKSGERHLENALPWDTIQAVDYRPWNATWDLARLKEASAARVAGSEVFRLVRERDKVFTDKAERSAVSLNIADLRREKEEGRRQEEVYRKALGLEEDGKAPDDDGEEDDPLAPKAPKAGDDSGEAEHKEWVKACQKDPYIQECLSILADMAQPAQPAAAR